MSDESLNGKRTRATNQGANGDALPQRGPRRGRPARPQAADRLLDAVGFYCLNDERRAGRKRFATFELNSGYGPSAEKCARAILARLDQLDRAGRLHLAACSKRVLDFGYDVGDTWGFGDFLSVRTLGRLTENGIGVALTLYPLHVERPARAEHSDSGDGY